MGWNKKFYPSINRAVTFDEATVLIGHGKFHHFLLFICGLSVLVVIAEGLNLGIILPFIKCDMKFSIAEQGLLNSASFIGIFFSSYMWGFLADIWGRNKILRITSTFSFLCSCASSFSINIWMLFGTRVLVGFFISGMHSSAMSYLSEFHSSKTRTRALTILSLSSTIGIPYAGLLSWFILPMEWQLQIFTINYQSWRFYILFTSLISLLISLATLCLPESPKYLLIIGEERKAIETLQLVYKINTGFSKETYPIRTIECNEKNLETSDNISSILTLMWKQTKQLFSPPHLLKTIILCFLMFIIYLLAHGVFMWYPDMLYFKLDNRNESYTTCTIFKDIMVNNTNNSTSNFEDCPDKNNVSLFIIISVIGLVLLTLNVILVILMKYINQYYLLIFFLLISAVSGYGIIGLKNFYINIILEVLFLSCGNCGAVISAIITNSYPTAIKAMAFGVIILVGRCGSILGSNIFGIMLNGYCETSFILYGTLLICCSISIYILIRSNKSQNESICE